MLWPTYGREVMQSRTGPRRMRALLALAFAFLLGVRLLSPPGFMPAFDRGSIAIVACPDYDRPAAPVAHHHHGDSKKFQQHCPYAAASAAAAPVDLVEVAALFLAGATLLLGRPFRLLKRQRPRDRPPSRGPPVPTAA